MLPKTLALVDDDQDSTGYLAEYLRGQGVARVDIFHDSSDLLVHDGAYGYEFYVVDLMLPNVDGVKLIGMLRRRTSAGILVVSGRLDPDVFKDAIEAGADMYLAKPVSFEQVALAITAIQRRAAAAIPSTPLSGWRLDRRASQLVAPDDARIDLSPTDLAVLDCFVEAAGEVVSRETLRQRLLGRDGATEPGGDGLNAAMFRLRRRIERATPVLVPLQSRSRIGYVFRAPLACV
jgi:two-component system, OmpR family, response regulator